MKVVDIERSSISTETAKLFVDGKETYTDRVLNEHLYDIECLLANNRRIKDRDVWHELEMLAVLCRRKNAGYVRIIY
jgi:hypothetical protein